jgi:hypothetical protein
MVLALVSTAVVTIALFFFSEPVIFLAKQLVAVSNG